MGACCGKPEVEDNKEATSVAVLGQEVLPSLSFIQGVQIRPSIATLGTEDGHSICVQQEGNTFFACLFTDVLPVSSAGSRWAAGDAWSSLQQALVKHPHSPEDAMQVMFNTIHSKLLAHNKLAARSKDNTDIGGQPAWVVGVAVLGDLQQRTLHVASVGCCHAAACHVAGAFAQATSTGVCLTETEELRHILQALAEQPGSSDAQAAAAGQVLGLAALPIALVAEKSAQGRAMAANQRLQLSEPGAGAAGRLSGSPAVHASATSSPARGNTQLPAAGTQDQRRNTTSGRLQHHGAGGSVPLMCQVSSHQLTSPCRHLFLMSDSLATSLSVPDLASLAHHFQPTHVQMLRNAAAARPVQLEPLPQKAGKGKAAQSPSSSRHATPGSKACTSPRSKTPPQGTASRPAPTTPTSHGKAVSSATLNRAGGSPTLSAAANTGAALSPSMGKQASGKQVAGSDGITLQIGGVELWQLPPAVEAPGFNLASLVLHHAKARQTSLRQRQARLCKAHCKTSPSSKSRPSQPETALTQPGLSASVDAGLLSGAATGAGVSLLVLSLDWPLSVTSQQVAMAAGVAASRAARPGAQYRWHMVRQLVRHMRSRKRRLLSDWWDVLSKQQAVLQQDRRAAEVLAWKHLGEAVQMVVGGGVVRVDSTPGTSPPNLSPSPTPSAFSPSLTPRKNQHQGQRNVSLHPAAQAHAAALQPLVTASPQPSSRAHSKSPKDRTVKEQRGSGSGVRGSVSIGGTVAAAGGMEAQSSLGVHESSELPTPTLFAPQQRASGKPWNTTTGSARQQSGATASVAAAGSGQGRSGGSRNTQQSVSLRRNNKAGASQVKETSIASVVEVRNSFGGDDAVNTDSQATARGMDGYAIVSSPANSPSKKTGTPASRSLGGAATAQDGASISSIPAKPKGLVCAPVSATGGPTKWQLDQERPCGPAALRPTPEASANLKQEIEEAQVMQGQTSAGAMSHGSASSTSQKVLSPPTSTGSSSAAVRGNKRATTGQAYSLRGSKRTPGK